MASKRHRKTLSKLYKDLKVGDSVRYSAGSNWNYSKIDDPSALIHHEFKIIEATPTGYKIEKGGQILTVRKKRHRFLRNGRLSSLQP